MMYKIWKNGMIKSDRFYGYPEPKAVSTHDTMEDAEKELAELNKDLTIDENVEVEGHFFPHCKYEKMEDMPRYVIKENEEVSFAPCPF